MRLLVEWNRTVVIDGMSVECEAAATVNILLCCYTVCRCTCALEMLSFLALFSQQRSCP